MLHQEQKNQAKRSGFFCSCNESCKGGSNPKGQNDQRGASNYWAKLKQRLKEEGADQLLTNCQQLKLKSSKDSKRYLTDVATTEQILRIIQSIPSKKAEPFKRWLAQVGRERIEETIDPELTIERALETYLKKGYSRE